MERREINYFIRVAAHRSEFTFSEENDARKPETDIEGNVEIAVGSIFEILLNALKRICDCFAFFVFLFIPSVSVSNRII